MSARKLWCVLITHCGTVGSGSRSSPLYMDVQLPCTNDALSGGREPLLTCGWTSQLSQWRLSDTAANRAVRTAQHYNIIQLSTGIIRATGWRYRVGADA